MRPPTRTATATATARGITMANDDDNESFDFDVLVVGSGFGGSVSALRLTEKGYRVGVLEAGRRFQAKDFAKTNWDMRKFLYFPRIGLKGIQRLDLLSDVLVLSGAGVGGGSLVYANTLYEPLDAFYQDAQWAHIADWQAELAPFYEQAKKMLGVTTAPDDSPKDDVMRKLGERMGVADTYRATEVGVFFGRTDHATPDPFFGGAGPERNGCTKCGGCMVGCRENAKNTLDRNYLYLAEQGGAEVLAERQVIDVKPLSGGGYEVTSTRPGPRRGRDLQTHRTEQIVFSAGVLGTIRLLADLKDRGVLAGISDRLGELTRTNSESIPGATRMRVGDADYSKGIAISSSIYPNPSTHVEAVSYPAGSNAMGLLSTLLVDGGGKVPRSIKYLGQLLRHPVQAVTGLSVHRWSERSVILLVMQSMDNSINLRWKRGRHGVRLVSEQGAGEPNPTYIPEASEAARETAKVIGGNASGSLNEALLDIPVTAHILGGCVIGADSATGVVDAYQRVFGHDGLHVADASTISANLGVNPSLTITAQTERAMSLWPNRGEADPRPPLGSPYQRVSPVAPHSPSVPDNAPGALKF